VRAVRTLCARCEHAAATACALWKRHGRCKDAVGTSCGRCRDAVRTLCTRYNWQIWYFYVYSAAIPQRADMVLERYIQTLWQRRLVWQGLNWQIWYFCVYSAAIQQRADMVLERFTNAVATPFGVTGDLSDIFSPNRFGIQSQCDFDIWAVKIIRGHQLSKSKAHMKC